MTPRAHHLRTLLALFSAVAVALALTVLAPVATPVARAVPSQGVLAPTPPMGFNDWAGFGCNIDEKLFTDTADAMASLGLRKAGYDYVNVDDCWMQRDRDADGNLQVDTTRFPHGMKWLADYVHARGLKFGIYEDAGYKTCQGAAGSYGHFQQDADLYASWGVDYLKLDYCYQPLDQYPGKTPAEVAHIVYHQASQAIANTGRPMIFSESAPAYFCCQGQNFSDVMSWIGQEGELWRFGSDIYDAWPSVLQNYREDNTPGLADYAGPDHWNDADMLEIGNGGLSLTEAQSQFTVWSELASPLLLSTTLSKLSPAELAVVENRDVIAVDQDPLGVQGRVVQSGQGYDVLSRPLANGDRAVVLFNKGDTAQTITTTAQNVGADPGSRYELFDLVSKRRTETTGTIAANVPPHGTVMYRVSTGVSGALPPATAVTVGSGTFQAGKPTPVKVTFTNHGSSSVDRVDVRLDVPDGWTVKSASRPFAVVKPGASVTATFDVVSSPPPPGLASKTLEASVRYSWRGQNLTETGAETVITNTPYESLAQAFNNIGVTDESNPAPGDFDGGGDSYSAQALAAQGATPGATITANGAGFTWPDAAAGTRDNVQAQGQLVQLSGSGSALAFLGAEAGFSSGTVTVTYTDGTTSSASLGFPNWCCSDQHAYGATPVIVTDHRNTPSGPANFGIQYVVFYNSIPLTAGKTVATVQLPDQPAIHVFAMAVQ
ncbi:MAG TPA: NEW3 domain-containing protein [Streptosporangiales bacterium]